MIELEISCPYKGKCFAESTMQCRVCDVRPETAKRLTIAEDAVTAIGATMTAGLLCLALIVWFA